MVAEEQPIGPKLIPVRFKKLNYLFYHEGRMAGDNLDIIRSSTKVIQWKLREKE